MRSTCCAALFALAMAGCSHAHAKASPPSPPLDVPAPPPRAVEPNDAEAPAPVPLPQEPARNAPPRPRPTPPREQPRPEAPRTEAPKPEPPATETPKPEEPPKPPTTLQTIPTTAEGEVERVIRATLQRANGDLNHVDYRALNADARSQYDTAKGMIRQADDAVRAKNLVFAKNLADKATALAAQLAGR
jgi:outer membrane biosynthesis protein TonB